MAGGIEAIAASISADLVRRLPRQNKKQREGLALVTATMLDVRSANLMDLAASLPRQAERIDMRYQYISRLLGNEHIDTDWVMAPFACEVLERASADCQCLVLIIDQTQANDTQQAVVVAVRVGGRSLPIAWRVKETEGAIGFAEQKAALEVARRLLPEGAKVVLMGDRFYGQPGPDRVVCRGRVGLAVAAQSRPARVRGRRRKHAVGVLRPRGAHVDRRRADVETRAD
jgi:hypothetical protein